MVRLNQNWQKTLNHKKHDKTSADKTFVEKIKLANIGVLSVIICYNNCWARGWGVKNGVFNYKVLNKWHLYDFLKMKNEFAFLKTGATKFYNYVKAI